MGKKDIVENEHLIYAGIKGKNIGAMPKQYYASILLRFLDCFPLIPTGSRLNDAFSSDELEVWQTLSLKDVCCRLGVYYVNPMYIRNINGMDCLCHSYIRGAEIRTKSQ